MAKECGTSLTQYPYRRPYRKLTHRRLIQNVPRTRLPGVPAAAARLPRGAVGVVLRLRVRGGPVARPRDPRVFVPVNRNSFIWHTKQGNK